MIELRTKQSGFALLLTLVVISVVLAIGLSLLNITVKQFTLSATARDSELAFHAADTGIECVQAYQSDSSTSVDLFIGSAPGSIPMSCGGASAQSLSRASGNPANVHQYSTTFGNGFTWNIGSPSGGSDQVCTEVDLFLIDAQGGPETYDFSSFGIGMQTCSDENVCTYIFSRGYNRPCDSLSGLRVVQREISLDF